MDAATVRFIAISKLPTNTVLRKKPMKWTQITTRRYLRHFILGGCFFTTCSFFQKLLAGYNPLVPEAYIMPLLFGGTAGIILTNYSDKAKRLNIKLTMRLNKLEEIMPICSFCKSIRKPDTDPKDQQSWLSIEAYVTERTNSQFSHSICPECRIDNYPNFS